MSTGKINLNINAGMVTGPRGLSISKIEKKETLPNGDNVYNVFIENNEIIGFFIAAKGEIGNKGDEGEKGDPGIGISKITVEKDGLTNKVTILLDDGTTKIINVLDGENAYELWLGEENEGTLNDFFEAFRGFSIGKIEKKETLPSGDNVYNVFIENNKKVGEIVSPKGDKGEDGNVNFATFEIIDGCLYANYTKDTEHMKFEINSKGELEVTING